jgi:hypothetical protein
MNDSMTGWDWLSGINAIALGWYSVLRGDPVPPPTGTNGGSVTIGPRGIAGAVDLGTLVVIGAIVLLAVVLLRKR